MPDVSGPFDGSPWAEAQWFRHASNWAPSGVHGSPAGSSSAGGLGLAINGLGVSVGLGRAWVRGAGYERTGTAWTDTVTANATGNPRRDRIVLRRDLGAKTVTLVRKAGTPAATPAPPTLTQVEDGVWEIPLFSFIVPANSGTTISGVIDERGWLGASGQRARIARASLSGAAGPTGATYQLGQTAPAHVNAGETLEHRVSLGLYAASITQTVTLQIARFDAATGARTVLSDTRQVVLGGTLPDDGAAISIAIDDTPGVGTYYWRVEAGCNVNGGSSGQAYVAYGAASHTVNVVA